jgi:hypothetical protein
MGLAHLRLENREKNNPNQSFTVRNTLTKDLEWWRTQKPTCGERDCCVIVTIEEMRSNEHLAPPQTTIIGVVGNLCYQIAAIDGGARCYVTWGESQHVGDTFPDKTSNAARV